MFWLIAIAVLQVFFAEIFYRQGRRHALRDAKSDGYIPMFED